MLTSGINAVRRGPLLVPGHKHRTTQTTVRTTSLDFPLVIVMAQPCRFVFENDRGQKLHGVEYVPTDSSKQWATLIWHHGVCEHKERYCAGK